MLYGGKENDIISQYVAFTKVYNEQMKRHGRSRDEERIMRTYVANERREAVREAVENMLKTGKMSAEEIAGYFKELSVEDV